MAGTGPPIDVPQRPRQPSEEVWRLRHPDGRELRCELRDDTAVGAGCDVLLFDAEGLMVSKRCADRRGAVYIATAWEQDNRRGGWGD